MRYAVSADVSVTAGTVLQFDLSMGCQATEDCYGNTTFFFFFSFLTQPTPSPESFVTVLY